MARAASELTGRWMAVGRSRQQGSRAAGTEASREALVSANSELIVVFASDVYDFPELLAGVREVTGATPLIGCSTAGEIASSGPGDATVVVSAIGGGFKVQTAVAQNASADLREAGAQAAGCITGAIDSPHRVLLLLTDGLAGDQAEIVRGAHSVVGAAVPLVGGCAGDDLKMVSTRQFFNGDVHTNAVVAAAIGSDAPFGIGVHHGWRPVGEPMVVTRSSDNRVYSLDGEPALDVYLNRLGAPDPARSNPAEFTRFALTHPLGLSRRSDEEQVRFIGDANFEDRSLGCIAEVPQGGLAWFMEGDIESVLGATQTACDDALDGLGGVSPLGLLAFDCIARRGVLGDDGIKAEIDMVSATAGNAPVAGFYTYGEIARTRGVTGFHNQTLVVLAVA